MNQIRKEELIDTWKPATCTFKSALDAIGNGDQLLRFLGRYASFNSVFASGVASLAATVRLREDLFRDPAEFAGAACSRIATMLFVAAVDEFGNETRADHRSLALATLNGTAAFFRHDAFEIEEALSIDNATRQAIERVLFGYGLHRSLNENEIFYAIGFNLGSELLADDEFNSLDLFLQAEYPALVKHLRGSTVDVGSQKLGGYDWVSIHAEVEAEHFDSALTGANLALFHYAGLAPISDVKTKVLQGFQDFVTTQKEFITHLAASA